MEGRPDAAEALLTLDIDLGGPVNLEATLECGQAFRWRRASFPGRPELAVSYSGVLPLSSGGQRLAVVVAQRDLVTDDLVVLYRPEFAVDASPEAVRRAVKTYFSSEDDLHAIERRISSGDPVMASATRSAHGLRVLRQDPWECLASYILSVNNNIPNIARTIDRLARCLGSPLGCDEFAFPSPELIACQESALLRQSRCGFRDRYLKDAAQRVASGEVVLASLWGMPTGQARERLMTIRGVGPKVADCVLLFAYHRLDVFPVDVWIARAMSRFYLGGRAVTPKTAREEGLRRFKDLAGYAQEYLFYHVRSGRD